MNDPSAAFLILAGAVLLIAGRRLFWLFVGAAGFLAGLRVAPVLLSAQPEWMQWLVALLCGMLGMFLAFVLQRFAVVLAGFVIGGLVVAELFGGGVLPFLAGGIMAALAASWLFEGALILLSSLAGANMIATALDLRSGMAGLVLIGLTVLGIAIQAGITARGAAPMRRTAVR